MNETNFIKSLEELENEFIINPADAVELAKAAREAGILPIDVYSSQKEDAFSEYEVWLPVPDYEEMEASNLGRVKLRGTIRKPGWDRNGYVRQTFRLHDGNGRKVLQFHRLCLSAFFGNAELYECDHINGNKSDNFLFNLEYVSSAENKKRAAQMYADNDKPVIVTRDNEYNFALVAKDITSAARETGVHATFILSACRSSENQTEINGYRFQFAPEEFRNVLPLKPKKKSKNKIA